MAIVVTEAQLRDLVRSTTELQRAIDAVEACTVAAHAGASGQVIFADLALEDSNYMKILGSAAPASCMGLQVFPAQVNSPVAADERIMMMFDGVTGTLMALFAGDDLNALRTSVPAALGARHLAPPDARVLGILGAGYQASSHALTITTAVPAVSEILVWSPTSANRKRFAEEQAAQLGLTVTACDTAEEVVQAADIVTAAGRTAPGQAAYEAAWVKPGALLISMTGSAPRELHDGARFAVPTQRRPERVAFGFNGVSAPRPAPEPAGVIELPDVIGGRTPAREHRGQSVVWELANVYLWDLPIMSWAHDWAVRNGIGHTFALRSASPEPTA